MSTKLDSAVGERLKFGEFELAPVARMLWRRGKPVKLGSRALDILIALASNPGHILSKDELTHVVWRGAAVDDTSLRVGMSAVRKALGGDGERFITTVCGRGYCFARDVETTFGRSAPEAPPSERLRPHRLPVRIARVVGREEVIASLTAEAMRRRLLSVVGAGGIGKTTVAIVVADRLRAAFDAVAFVELASIESGPQMSAAIIAALGLNLRLQENPIDDIAAAVANRRVLIVLDNCEHVVSLAATFVEALLGGAPGVTILATSRERLRAEGEWVQQISPLDAPPDSPALTAEEARAYPAVEMFEERAAFALGGYQLSDADARCVAEICRRLDGIALAIELAAGRLQGLGVQGLANSLEDCFAILTHGRRTALPRHQTLRATLDWSYRLLTPEDQAALSDVSVFHGSFTLEDAAFVMDVRLSEASDRLTSLLDKSLVIARRDDQTFRYRLLDTTRTYAQDKLESGGAQSQRRRHAQRFLQACRPSNTDEDGETALRRGTADVRAALEWSLVRGGDLALGVDLASAATPVFLKLSLLREHKKYLDLALDHIVGSASATPPSEAALRSEMALRTAVAQAEYYTEGWELVPENQLLRARDIARDIGDEGHELRVLWMLYGQAGNVGSYRQALHYARLFEASARRAADPTAEFRSNRMLARALSDLGQHGRAQHHIEQALRFDQTATPSPPLHAYDIDHEIAAKAILARTLWLRGYPDDAKAVAEECLAEAMQRGHEQSTCWAITFNMCPVAIWRGDIEKAHVLVGILLERSQQAFQHYHEWGLLYRRFLGGAVAGLGQRNAGRHSAIKPTIPAQVDLFSTFDGGFLGADTLARARSDEDIWCAPELLRVSACPAVSGSNEASPRASEAMLLRSLDLAKRQDARAWELRTATSLARLYLKSAGRSKGRAVLTPVLEQFKQGRDTQDAQAAIKILRSLANG
jgi:predicted ATPase